MILPETARVATAASLGAYVGSPASQPKGEPEIPVAHLVEQTRRFAQEGRIDPVAGLADDRVWIYSGAADPKVHARVTDALEAYHRAFVAPSNLVRVDLAGASHTFPTTDTSAAPCDAIESPFLGNCGLDGARVLLAHLYGDLAPGQAAQDVGLVKFDQAPYAALSGSVGLARPAGCTCHRTAGPAGPVPVVCTWSSTVARRADRSSVTALCGAPATSEVAEANRIVLLFPQIEKSLQPLNALGCWDWWGYDGADYATRDGRQIRAVRAMVAHLLGEARTAHRAFRRGRVAMHNMYPIIRASELIPASHANVPDSARPSVSAPYRRIETCGVR